MKKLFYSIVVLGLIVGGVYTYIQIKLNDLEAKMHQYLVVTNDYKESDILRVEAVFSKMPTYSVNVVFKDEPDVTYNYTFRNELEWIQLGPSDGEIEENQGKYKHIDKKRLN
ncbi:DUF3139 domain-containing protein [Brevibacillus sp. MER 51]|uniref:DUF3139 domain-containing protein n=1 Tax=Brevibacillus sp. MER 51 TaxID=2939560 RepID=UPI00203DEFFC|nr:DUF3139 domain-containing protein [Brevibacillus sp. MER 51]MCM3145107.1 DUF3139 domain-containing protein [Brevibacillus sp. MER 51]